MKSQQSTWQVIENYNEILDHYLKHYNDGLSDHNLANYLLWGYKRDYYFQWINNNLCVKSIQNDETIFYFPFGEKDLITTVEVLLHDAAQHNSTLRFGALSLLQQQFLAQHFPNTFEFQTNRDDYDYVYPIENLITLKGTSYRRMRNHLNRFRDLYRYQYETLSNDIILEIKAFYNKWLHTREITPALQNEYLGVMSLLMQHKPVSLLGAVLRVDNEIIAFTLGEAISDDTVVIHIEKALANFHGAYQAINQMFLENECREFTYVNREPDLGIEGLRQAKLSYRPQQLLEKFSATLI